MFVHYGCSKCGKTFDDSDECSRHEIMCGITEEQQDFVAFDNKMIPMSFSKFIDDVECDYLYIGNRKALNFVNQQFKDYGFLQIPECEFEPDSYYYYDFDFEGWRNLGRCISKLLEVLQGLQNTKITKLMCD